LKQSDVESDAFEKSELFDDLTLDTILTIVRPASDSCSDVFEFTKQKSSRILIVMTF